MMKNLLILGSARSGKSTLASLINKRFGHSIVAIDAFVTAFQEVYPRIGIKHSGICNELISPFVASYLKSLTENHPNCKFVVEGWHMHPRNAERLIDKNSFDIIVLGYPQLTSEEAFDNIKKFEKPTDYTINMDNARLLDLLSRHINHSKQFQEDCKELGLKFVDTSFNRQETLNKLIENFESTSHE